MKPLDDQVRLPDGRHIDVLVGGAPEGIPLVFHHGTPGAALQLPALERGARARGMRLVTMSRPGYGDSDRDEGRDVVDAVADTAAVLDSLGERRCVVAGWSGGGPHALACAARLDGVVAALLIAGVAPYHADGLNWLSGMGDDNLAEFAAALDGPDELRTFLDAACVQLKTVTPDDFTTSLGSVLPDSDRRVLTDEFADYMAASFHEALRTGVDGWLDDDIAFTKPWGFELEEISIPTMVWQGSDDLMVPFGHGEWLASHIPTARVHLENGQGHLSVLLGALDRMLDELAAAAS